MKEPIKKRILFVEGNIDGTIGGSYFSLLFLVSGLDRSRFEPLVAFATPNELLPRFQANGIRTVILPEPRPVRLRWGYAGRFLAKGLNLLRGMLDSVTRARLLQKERISLVHLNNSITRNHSWIIAARLAQTPCITHERGINPSFAPRDRALGRHLKAVICISRAVHDNFVSKGLGRLPLITIHNGLDPAQMRVTKSAEEVRAHLGIGASERVVGIVGNIKPWKGQEVVVRAISRLKDEFPDVSCLLIGASAKEDESYRQHMYQLIEELGLKGRVHVSGFVADVANYVNILEIQVHASVLPEPFGRVLLEAMALSKPLVASAGGAVGEIVLHETTGLTFEPGNADALAACLRKFLSSPEQAAAMGRAGRERLLSDFTIQRNVEQTQQLYDRLMPG